MKKLFISVSAMLFPVIAHGTDIGLSAALGDASEIRVPIKTENFLFEPYISRYTYTDEYKVNEYELNGSETRNTELGVSIWKHIELDKNFYAQLGLNPNVA